LLREVWGYDYFGGTRTVDVHVRRLRAKLGSEYESMIGTVRQVGYKFVVPRPGPAEQMAEHLTRNSRSSRAIPVRDAGTGVVTVTL
jgi:DNA-binding winged helix-turn-helix (wHTH) protein